MLDGLALAGRSAFGDGPTDKNNELSDAWPLEVPEMGHIGSV